MKTKSEEKRQAIVNEAAQAFRAMGFERTSMSEICSRVGGSKATIYNYFPSKEELFAEVILQSTQAEFDAVHACIDKSTGDIADSLRTFGKKLLSFLYSHEIQASRHMAIAQAKHSELGRVIYERGVMRSQKLVAEFLKESMAAGKLRQAPPEIATRHLISLLESEFIDRFLFHLSTEELTEAEITEATTRAIEVFMAAYAPKP
ncbi:TetR/AcrR family transcriptional regulator [Geomonas subterranea]|uniref:TetR/AcrR family transcriptional regulator n=1 Tax=Geomonas subterranea TaxID=2847989 RepID=A0ABX8LIS6_9BACT|nr:MULTISPECIES: TetR/AcrR family transcriptional regulator [Geomonas]QXE91633.1 TetR/AcrR family transcriptional regulator [Geomonas subterranea]QXM10275.1 TetR/AcrR family transcriptional regulator [Geomonas subterranea]